MHSPTPSPGGGRERWSSKLCRITEAGGPLGFSGHIDSTIVRSLRITRRLAPRGAFAFIVFANFDETVNAYWFDVPLTIIHTTKINHCKEFVMNQGVSTIIYPVKD